MFSLARKPATITDMSIASIGGNRSATREDQDGHEEDAPKNQEGS
jgi:hypothetical protein